MGDLAHNTLCTLSTHNFGMLLSWWLLLLLGIPAARGTQYGPPGLASVFVYYVRCALLAATLLSFILLLVIALVLVRLSHIIVNAGPKQLGMIVWRVAVRDVAVSPGAA